MIINSNQKYVYSLSIDSSHKKIAWCGFGDTIRQRKLDEKTNYSIVLTKHTKRKNNSFNCVCFNPKFNEIATASDDSFVEIWNIDSLSRIAILKGHTGSVCCVTYNDSGTLIASCGSDKTVRIWNNYFEQVMIFESHKEKVLSVCFHPHKDVLVSCGVDKKIQVWCLKSETLGKTLNFHTDAVSCVRFDKSGEYLASSSWDKTIAIWDVKEWKVSKTLKSHITSVSYICFHHKIPVILSCSWDFTIKAWDFKKGTLLNTFIGHKDCVNTVSFASKNYFISGSDDETIMKWNLTTGEHFKNLLILALCHSSDPESMFYIHKFPTELLIEIINLVDNTFLLFYPNAINKK